MLRILYAICCYNGEKRIEDTLRALASQTAQAIVLIDNGSTDKTVEKALKTWGSIQSKTKLLIVHEHKKGLLHARLKAFQQALMLQSEVICFVDDDNRLIGDWTPRISHIMTQYPSVGAVGGYGIPCFEDAKPYWFDVLQGAFACGPQASHPGIVGKNLYGAALSIRMSAWKSISKHFKPRLVGRTGTRMLAGEDSELCLFLRKAGWNMYYDDELKFYHFMPAQRLEITKVKKMFFGFGMSSRILCYRESCLSSSYKAYARQILLRTYVFFSALCAIRLFLYYYKSLIMWILKGQGNTYGILRACSLNMLAGACKAV